jgi:hypothetical protein
MIPGGLFLASHRLRWFTALLKTDRHERSGNQINGVACNLVPSFRMIPVIQRPLASVMKTIRSASKEGDILPHDDSACRTAILLGISLLWGICLCSCSVTTISKRIDRTATKSPSPEWVKVHAKPPTWFPRGVPADCPTDSENGEWVITENSQNTQYFIPLRGLTKERRNKLLHEALADRSPNKKNRIAREDASQIAKGCAATLFYLSPLGWMHATTRMSGDDGEGLGGIGGAGISHIKPSIGSIGSIGCPGGTAGCPGGG